MPTVYSSGFFVSRYPPWGPRMLLTYRALFKIAVELGAVTHMLAAVHEIDDDTMIKLRAMCIDEVKRINGVINFEKAVRYQRLD